MKPGDPLLDDAEEGWTFGAFWRLCVLIVLAWLVLIVGIVLIAQAIDMTAFWAAFVGSMLGVLTSHVLYAWWSRNS